MAAITNLTALAKPITHLSQVLWHQEKPFDEVSEAIVRLRTNPTILPPVQIIPRSPLEVYHRAIRTEDSYQIYHTYDLRRFHKIHIPNRHVIDKAIVRGRTNTRQGLHWIFRLANAYFKSERLVIKIQRSRIRQWRSKRKIEAEEIQKRIALEDEEERDSGHDFAASMRARKDYIVSTAGVPRQWQMFLEDVKTTRCDFDLPQWEDDFTTGDDHNDQESKGCPISLFREKWFTDGFDEALVGDGLDMVVSTCDCLWNTRGVNRSINLIDIQPCDEDFKLRCWGCKFVRAQPVD
jgi:hypothetical protein